MENSTLDLFGGIDASIGPYVSPIGNNFKLGDPF